MIKSYILKHKLSYLLGVFTLFVVDLLSLYIPQLTGEITDGLDSSMEIHGIYRLLLAMLGAAAGMAVGRFLWRYFLFGTARKIERDVRADLFEHIETLSPEFFNKNKTGDLMSYFTNDLAAVRMAIGPAVISAFDGIVMTIMVVVKMITYVNLKLTLLACIPMAVIMAGAVYFIKVAEQRYTIKQEAFSDLSDMVQESFSGIRVIKAFTRERGENRKFDEKNIANMKANKKVVRLNVIVFSVLELIIGVCSVLTLLYGGSLVQTGEISVGKFVAFNSYIGMLVWPMIAIGDSINSFSQGLASMKRIQNLFSRQAEITDGEQTDKSIEALTGEIELNNLTYAYPETERKVLNGVSVKVPAGSTLAIIGKTGCGKSTIANLLVRSDDVEDGMLKIDGHDVKSIPLNILRRDIAIVPQDNFLFSDSVQANIAFGVRDAVKLPHEKTKLHAFSRNTRQLEEMVDRDTLKRSRMADEAFDDLDPVIEAAKKACVHDNIMDFPEGYSTMIGERGVTMSGGQKQRSAIARALMKDAPVLILDDSLSAVDTDTEEQILKNLKNNRSGKTTIIIAHRISTIMSADIIMVMDDGKIVECGNHESLMKQFGVYERLYEKQQLEKELAE